MNQKFLNVRFAAALTIFWLVVSEVVIAIFGVVDTAIAWIPFGAAPVIFAIVLAGLNWLTSESR